MEQNEIHAANAGFFLGVGPKTQGPKNSNSRILAPKLKDFLFENSTNRQVCKTKVASIEM